MKIGDEAYVKMKVVDVSVTSGGVLHKIEILGCDYNKGLDDPNLKILPVSRQFWVYRPDQLGKVKEAKDGK